MPWPRPGCVLFDKSPRAGLQRIADAAVDTLRVMTDSEAPASARVQAARITLEMAVRAVEMEKIGVHLSRLEQAMGK